jgi:hypothetical protein
MLTQLLISIAIMTSLIVFYFLVQRGLRRVDSDIREDSDVLETRWGCGGCIVADTCELNPGQCEQ